MAVLDRLLRVQEIALCLIRKWWRPISCVWISLTMLLHGFVLPVARFWKTGAADTDLNGLSLLVSATAAAFAVREWGKIKGSAE